MADDIRPGDYITFRELVDREEKLRSEMRSEAEKRDAVLKGEMSSRFINFGHEVAKQFVDEREKHPVIVPDVQSIRQQVVEMAKGKDGSAVKYVGIGMIMLAIAILSHHPWAKAFIPF